MKKHFVTACLYTVVTAVILGIFYPLAITASAKIAFKDKAEGQLIRSNGEITGSKLISQPFTGPRYFHSRPSAAGAGYDASASSGSNLAPTNKTLIDRVRKTVATENTGTAVPIDLATTSGSGLDPDITPAAAFYQVSRISKERNLPEDKLEQLVTSHITPRQFGLLGEPRVNVLQLNLDLDALSISTSH